jgi:hypothetical protein
MRRKLRLYLIGILSLEYVFVLSIRSYRAISKVILSNSLSSYLEYSAVMFGVLNAIYQIAFQTPQGQYLYGYSSVHV